MAVMRKVLDVVFSRLRPSIMNGGAYGLGRAVTIRPLSPAAFFDNPQVIVS